MKQHVLKVREGEVTLSWPEPLSRRSYQEVADWMADALASLRASIPGDAPAEPDDDANYRY